MKREATVPRFDNEPVSSNVRLMVCMPTPFTLDGIAFQTSYGARGTVFRRHYIVHRNGFDGPLTVRLADRQIRHLQGVTGDVLKLGADQSEFDYPVYVPTWLEMNRTSRTVIMAVAEVTDEEGRSHQVAFTSGVPKDQIILLTAPSPMSVRCEVPVVEIAAESSHSLPVEVNRGQLPAGEVTITVLVPDHFGQISAEPVTIAANSSRGIVQLNCGSRLGPMNMPVTIRATTRDERGDPVIADTHVELLK